MPLANTVLDTLIHVLGQIRIMQRRRALVLLALGVAGCSGQSPPDTPAATATAAPTTDTPAATETATTTDTPTATATDTATDTPRPTDTPEPTPSDAERAGQRALSNVHREFDSAVRAYTSDIDDDDILDVTAATAFYSAGANAALADVQKALNEARKAVVTDSQTREYESLETTWQVLRYMIEAQAPLVDAFDSVEAAQEAAEDDDRSDMISAIEEMDTGYRDARAPTNELKEFDSDDLWAYDDLDDRVYERKVTQFEDEIDVFDDLEDPLRELESAIGILLDARRAREEERRSEAREAADEFEELADEFEEWAEELPDGAEAFEDVFLELSDLSVEREEEANELAG